MKKLISIIIILLFQTSVIYAGAFDRMGAGVRAKGMGDAFTAIADDASAVYWNPAGLSQITKKNILLDYKNMYSLGLLNYGEFFFVQPGIWKGSIGFGYRHFGTSDKVTFLDYTEHTLTVAYGCEIIKNLRLGLALKYYDVEFTTAANGYGVDLSAMYNFLNYFSLGATVQDALEPEIEWESGAVDRLPLNVNVGLGFTWEDWFRVDLDLEKLANKEEDPELHIGVEYWLYKKNIGFRIGGYQQRAGKWVGDMGFGLRYGIFGLDYTYENHYLLDGSHFVSISTEF